VAGGVLQAMAPVLISSASALQAASRCLPATRHREPLCAGPHTQRPTSGSPAPEDALLHLTEPSRTSSATYLYPAVPKHTPTRSSSHCSDDGWVPAVPSPACRLL